MELQDENAKLEHARGESLQLLGAIAQNQQARSELRRQEDAGKVHRASSAKDGNTNTSKEEVAHDNQESQADQRVDTKNEDTEASNPQQQKGDTNNIPSESTTPTWINFDIVGKTGIKIPSLALVDLKEDKSFMSYSTWVLSGKPTIDEDKKII